MTNKIEYKPLEECIKEWGERYDKTPSGKSTDAHLFRNSYLLGCLEAQYKFLCLQIDKHNQLESAREIIEPNY